MTNENTTIECPELEQMRAQYEMLKQSIDDHVQVKQNQLQKAMQGYMNRNIKMQKLAFWLLLFFLSLDIYRIFSNPEAIYNRSNIVSLVVKIVGVICIYWQLRSNRSKLKNIESNPLEIANDLRKRRTQKPTWKNWIWIALIPVTVFGILWFQDGNALFHHSPLWYFTFFTSFLLWCLLIPLWSYYKSRDYVNAVQQYEELEELKKLK